MKVELLEVALGIARRLKKLHETDQRQVILMLADLVREKTPEPPAEGRRMVPVSEAARVLKISGQRVRRMAQNGRLRSERHGNGRILVELPQ